ncbi:MAG: tRNA (adenosine(37)-N6)-threonylcarbamoyltransferase complex ATPase subunit type 1 TsaE [Acidobacteriia bacterium]|nr:tRNA (adenosine(37)-N6)-threonylcarbamoyltransferase complex ATPase subunit type 1 TsaE [Terriglobia bacterium]
MPRRMEPTTQEISTHASEETYQFGFNLGRSLSTPRNVLLFGELGVGKTVLAKGLVCGLGIEDPNDVVSPSFTLIQEYHINARIIHHVDLYRVDDPREIEGLGLEELLLDDSAYVIVEWADKLPLSNIPGTIHIHMRDLGDDDRAIQVEYR